MLGDAQNRPRVLVGFVQCEGRWKRYRNLLQMAVEQTGEDHMEVHTSSGWSNELVYEMLAILDVSTAVVSQLKINSTCWNGEFYYLNKLR